MVHWDVMYVMYVVDLGTPGSLIMMVMGMELVRLQHAPVQMVIPGGVVIMMIVAIVIIMN